MIKFENITKKIGSKTILENINLTIEKGSLIVLIGSSGCGKTTSLKMINKLIEPTSGEIYINNMPISKMNTIDLRRGIGYVIQNTGLFPHMTIKENISLIPKLKNIESKESIATKTNDLLNLVGLCPEDYLDKYPSELSGGQQQRVGVARAFASDAEIILMDEPFSALDPITRSSLQEELFSLQQELHKTIIFVTHDMEEAIKLADKICIMINGTIAQFDTPENILKNPANDFIKDFIGTNRVWDNPEFIKATDIMIKTPISVSSSRNILQAIEIMRTNKVDSLLIVDKSNILKGLVTLKDIKRSTAKETKLEDIMEHDVISVYEDDNILKILELINAHSFGYIPVITRDNHLAGLVTRSSLISVLSEQFLDMEDSSNE
ncbi:betaine/proline/choline family ABC transporter ATP-binding protein [Clostridium gasigenes]|uniref:Quaternary amine transport ATP-binding protein n=1 Tax=Clostridium gasigenes TaxID=94869 RepID=A0A1H0NIV6_9CLOT|nr:betaine/proline/choline family ABC transporter ATP-binding protein [Clostridium gasigenes]MBB6623962.1 betaine/proline/choline family ABC transporter ATP-binding protein [Clostridium gasigenes]MBB6716066.1 betaine/proline/choline family ABC transporter ATP-binding protein [Clostridium gasigenes]MBU3087514.1 betaine/proline/choline family ABC transporter ATP-binding protein [Clostridium gasigenes]MBU3103124.1 betaine/proline/choline family ABC transporter ATP-binding protein [Clostridium gasi